MPDRSIDLAITVTLVILAWGLLLYARRDLSSGEFRLGVVVLGVITLGFLLGQAFERRAR